MRTDIPIVKDLPGEYTETKDQHKFVQFMIDDDPFLRTRSENAQHYDIVRDFCEELEIGFREENENIVYPNNSRVRLIGMGRIYLLEENYFYHGNSIAYGLEPDETHMSRIGEKTDKKFVRQ